MGVSKTILEGKIKIGSDVSEAISGFKTLEKTLQKLNLGSVFNEKIGATFAKLYKSGEKMSEAIASGFKNKGDVAKYNTALTQMESALTSIRKELAGIDPKKIDWTTPQIDQLKKDLQGINNEIAQLGSQLKNGEAFQSLERLLNSKQGQKSVKFKEFFEAFDKGDLTRMQALVHAMETVKSKTKEGTEANIFWKEAHAEADKVTKQFESDLNTKLNNQLQKTTELEAAQTSEVELGTKAYETFTQDVNASSEALIRQQRELGKSAENTSELNSSLDRFKQRAAYFFGMENAVHLFRRAIRAAFNDVKELDQAMTQTAVVTEFSIGDLWSQLPDYTKRANALGVSIKSAYEAATLYYQQGLKTNEVIAVSTETLKMARIAGLDAATATDRMTNALRGFNMEINEASAQKINDVYSKLAAITASDVDEISTAMTKVASLANNANMSFEKTAAFLSQIIETTRESAETAGTALKTVVARFSEVKELYTKGQLLGTDEEGEEIHVNRVSKALATAGINLNEYLSGMKGLDDIFIELASKWDGLDEVQQRYIATMAAGSRQQSRFIAMMQDYQRTLELVDAAENSTGASTEQFNKTLESLETKLNQLKNAWTTFTTGIANSSIIKIAVDLLTKLLNTVNNITGKLPGFLKMLANTALAAGSLYLGKALIKNMFSGAGAAFFSQGLASAKEFGTGFSAGLKGVFASKSAIEGYSVVVGDARRTLSMWDAAVANSTKGSIENTLALLKQRAAQADLAALEQLGSNVTFSNMNAAQQSAVMHRLLADEKFREAVANGKVRESELKETASKLSNIDATQTSLLMRAKSKVLILGEKLALKQGLTPAMAEQTTATVVQNGATRALTVTTGTAIKALGLMAIKVAAVAAVMYGLYKAVQALAQLTPEARLKKAEEAAKKLGEEATKLRDTYRDIVNETSNLDELIEKQKALAKTSKEWNEGIQSINDSVKSLIDKYADLADFMVYDSYLNTWTLDMKRVNAYNNEKNREATTKEIQAALANRDIANTKYQGYLDVFNNQIGKTSQDWNEFIGLTDEEKVLIGKAVQGDLSTLKQLGINVKDYNTGKFGYDPTSTGDRLTYVLQHMGYAVHGNGFFDIVKAIEKYNFSDLSTVDTELKRELITNFSNDEERAAAELFGTSTLDKYVKEYGQELGIGRYYDDIAAIAQSDEFKKLLQGNFSFTAMRQFSEQIPNIGNSNLLDTTNLNRRISNMMTVAQTRYANNPNYLGYEVSILDALMQNLNETQQGKWVSTVSKYSDRLSDPQHFESEMADTISRMLSGLTDKEQQSILSLLFSDNLDWGKTSTWERIGQALDEVGKNGDAFAESCINITKAVSELDIEAFNTGLETTSKLYKSLSEDNRVLDEDAKNKLLSLGYKETDFAGMTFIGDIEEARARIQNETVKQAQKEYTTLVNALNRTDISSMEIEDLLDNFKIQIQGLAQLGESAGLSSIYENILNTPYNTIKSEALDGFIQGLKGAISESDSLYVALKAVEDATTDVEKEAATFRVSLLLKSQGNPTVQFQQLGAAIKDADFYLTADEENLKDYKVTLSEVTKEAQEAFGSDLITADFVKDHRDKFKEIGEGSTEALEDIRFALDNMYVYYKSMLGESDEFGIYDLSTNYSEAWADALERLGFTVDRINQTAVDTAKIYTDTLKKSGSGSGSDKDNGWKNPFDQLHNQLEAITAVQTKRNQLERQYNRLLKDEGATQTDVVNKLRERLDNLREEQALQRGLAEGRRKQLLDYAYSDKNAKYSQYIWEGQNGKIYIDWDAIDRAGHADPDEGKRIEEYVNEVKRLNDSYLEASDKADEITDSIEEVRQTIIDSYVNYQNMIKDALIHQEQKRIDMMSKINDSINDATDKLFDQAQKQIDEYRQTRENEKTESEIADKEARLAYLRRDTSGANALEIKKLEEELGDARQDYADSRIDQALEEMRNEADLAAEQRAEQIAIEQGILNYMDEIGAFWPEVERLMAESVDENGKVITGSELEELLKKDGAFGSLSDVAKGQWSENYKSQVKENSKAALNNALYENSSDSKKVATVASTTEQEKTFNAMLDATGNYANGMKSLHFDSDTTYQQAKDYYQRLGYGVWDRGNNTMMVTDLKALASSYGISYKFLDKIFQDGLITSNKGLKLTFPEDFSQISDASLYFEAQGYTATNGKKYGEGRNILYLKGNGYSTGGLADFTGPAWLDGSRSHPEYVLNAAQTEGFLQLVDMFTKPQDAFSGNPGFGDNYFDIDINAEIGSDYDVDQLVERIKTKITEDSMYRNVNAISFIR